MWCHKNIRKNYLDIQQRLSLYSFQHLYISLLKSESAWNWLLVLFLKKDELSTQSDRGGQPRCQRGDWNLSKMTLMCWVPLQWRFSMGEKIYLPIVLQNLSILRPSPITPSSLVPTYIHPTVKFWSVLLRLKILNVWTKGDLHHSFK